MWWWWGFGGVGGLVDVLGQPAEALAVALSPQHSAHEHLQGPRVQLLHRHVTLGEGQRGPESHHVPQKLHPAPDLHHAPHTPKN